MAIAIYLRRWSSEFCGVRKWLDTEVRCSRADQFEPGFGFCSSVRDRFPFLSTSFKLLSVVLLLPNGEKALRSGATTASRVGSVDPRLLYLTPGDHIVKSKNISRTFRRLIVGLVAAALVPSASIGLSGCGVGGDSEAPAPGSVSVPREGAGKVDAGKAESKPAPKRPRVRD